VMTILTQQAIVYTGLIRRPGVTIDSEYFGLRRPITVRTTDEPWLSTRRFRTTTRR
jgi:hypothetical protein